jgi:Uncharacterised nucleotidyltransferase
MKHSHVLSNIPKELKLQLELLKIENEIDINKLDKQLFKSIDWDEFINLAVHHRTFAYLYPRVKGISQNLIPASVVSKLRKKFKSNTFQMIYLAAEIDQINKKMVDKGIRMLFLKGPSLAADIYGDISLRTSGDIDVLIPLEDLDSVDKFLISEGYVKDDYIKSVLSDWKWRHHHVTYIHPVKNIKFEVHWRLNPGPGSEPSFDVLWNRKRTSLITAYPIYILGIEDLFYFLVSHGSRHGWSRLRWLIDIERILKKDLDVNNLLHILRKYHSIQLAGQALILISELFSVTIKKEFTYLMKKNHSINLANKTSFYLKNKVNLHTNPVPQFVSHYHNDYLFFMKTKTQKLLFLLSFLYPYPEDKETLPLPRLLHFLYFPLRPLLWVWNKTREREQQVHLEDYK